MNATSIAQKVSAEHLARAAYLYVRQSTLRQVQANTESGERQYALRRRAVQLGWPAEQDRRDRHRPGPVRRELDRPRGFQRLVADVGLGKAGIVLGLEVSRLARNNADWHRLLEICALAGTLICDEDGLYDPADFNDRLLLGLKGTMSEAEHSLHPRPPAGRDPLQGTPRRAADAAAGRARPGSGRQGRAGPRPGRPAGAAPPVRHLRADRLGARGRLCVQPRAALFPSRIRSGERKGELAWSPLTHWRVLRTLHNPRYAGAFAYGQRRTRKTAGGKTTSRQLPREQWTALILDSHPGYLTWEQFEHNQRLLTANAYAHGSDRQAGPAREGPALLQGLAICGRCGRRMSVRYHERRGTLVPDYQCIDQNIQRHAPRCLTIPGHGVDQAIGQLLLDTVTPLALEVTLTVQAELEARAEEADRLRRSHVERARHQAELARRRYLAVDPDNRLVADTLEADWNDSLRALQAAQDEYERASAAAQAALDDRRKAQIRKLASDFPALWTDPATPPRERKRIARLLIDDITLNKTDRIHLHVRFRGGQTHSLTTPLPLNSWQARQTDPDTLALIDRLLDDHTDAETAEQLNAAGRRSGMNKPFTARIVLGLRRRCNLPSHADRLRTSGLLTLDEIATQLDVHTSTIKAWHRAGLLQSHKANDKNQRLFEPPAPGDTRLVKRQGRRLTDREPTPSTPGGAM